MKIFLAVVAGLVLALLAFWLVFVRAPAPAEVCQHIIDVTVAEAGQSQMASDTQETLLQRMHDQCIEHKRNKIQLRGKIEYASYARCVVAATTLQGVESC